MAGMAPPRASVANRPGALSRAAQLFPGDPSELDEQLRETAPIVALFLVLFAVDPYALWQTPSTLGVKLTVAAFLYALLIRLLRTTRFRRQDFYGLKRLVPLAASVIGLLWYLQSSSSFEKTPTTRVIR